MRCGEVGKKYIMKKIMSNKLEMYSYESFCVYELLVKDSKNANVEFRSMDDVDGFVIPPDLYAPNGIPSLDIEGKTVVEIKRSLSYSALNDLKSFCDEHTNTYNVVVVYITSSLSSIPKREIQNDHSVLFVSLSELKGNKKASKEKEKFYTDKAKKDWKEERETIIKHAIQSVSQGNNVLFLGAGVSMSAKMPSWVDLLQGLMGEVKQLKEPTLSAFKELSSHVLQECGDSYLIMARYLQTAIRQYDKNANFSELIQKYLYNEKDSSDLLDVLTTIIQQKKRTRLSHIILMTFLNRT